MTWQSAVQAVDELHRLLGCPASLMTSHKYDYHDINCIQLNATLSSLRFKTSWWPTESANARTDLKTHFVVQSLNYSPHLLHSVQSPRQEALLESAESYCGTHLFRKTIEDLQCTLLLVQHTKEDLVQDHLTEPKC